MEPISAISALVGLVDVALRTASALVEYTKNTQNASAERKLLAEEAHALSTVLERFRDRTQNARPNEKWLDTRKDLIKQFARAYDDLANSLNLDASTGKLKQESRLKSIRTLSKWSFTKNEVYSLLERITRLQQYASTILHDEQHSLIERIDQRQQEGIDMKQKQTILSWLSPLQTDRVHQTISSRAEEGSGRWFVTSNKFSNWQCGEQNLLWCSGIPGAGKTVIASIVVEYLRRQRETNKINSTAGIAVIYLKYNDSEQTLENILACLISQLAQRQKFIPKCLEELYERHHDQNSYPSLDEISATLLTLVATYTEVFLIIDALDECSDELRWGLMEKLRVSTSNFERLEIKANKADLELFIDHHIQKNKNLGRVVEKSPGMRVDIKEAVVKTAEDMFLLARLHVESLASAAALSIKHVRKKLQTLPTTLLGTYDEAMRRIEAQEPDHKEIALKTLAWVSYAFRSLSLGELQHALVVEPGHTELDEELLMDGHSITALCAGLVIVEPETNVVNLVHYTTKNYFESIRLTRFPGFHATITMSCATYLALKELKDTSIWEIVRNFPLACYAAQYMGDHARQNPEEALEPSVLTVICRLLSHPDKRKPLLSLLDGLDLIKSGFYSSRQEGLTEDKALGPGEEQGKIETASLGENSTFSTASTAGESSCTILNLSSDDNYEVDGDETDLWEAENKASHMPEVTALHLAASMGLARVASLLLNEVPNIDAVDETGKTALAVAMERGFEKAVEFLVNSGALVDLSSAHGQGVFLLVTESDWYNVAEIIATKANSSFPQDDTSHWQYPVRLLLAAYDGKNIELQRLIEQEKIDLKGSNRDVGTMALFLSVERKHPRMVQSLLDAGVDVDSKDSRGQTSLHRATRRENETLMRLLLKYGAEVDCMNDDGRTAWSANVRSRNESLLAVLLEAGANPNTRGHQGVSELYDAATNGETEVVRFMLQSGTDPSIKTQFGWAPLHWAAYYGHVECVKLLVEAGAELSPVSDQDASPLDLSIRANQIVIVDLLTRAGALEGRDVLVSTPSIKAEDGLPVDGWCTSLPNQNEDSIPQSKLSLAFDKPLQQGLNVGQFIYPSTIKGPKDYIYQVSHLLETLTGSLGIRQAKRRADMVEYPLDPEKFELDNTLYDIVRVTLDYQTLEIRPKNQSSLSGIVQMRRDWTGGWKIHHHHQGVNLYLFRTTPDWSKLKEEGCRWMTENGTLLARSGMEGVTPVFTFEHGSDRQMQDILVTCWVAKLWSETAALQRRDEDVPKMKPVDE